ncbi:ABC transporter permease [Muricauda sp. SCSIO 64092]|uniref:ABC transporter permease n=1 Tax=Allomuricauda sp. SCSIO 64092 TaxID=2908842 RepID=UPI001FF6F95D|nr:ABC transporter permease [Muricauda sp. SCSIO 64092]UOY05864.1 ABC transporter permease [Muricauda sp. SCSIO 64092]
MSYNDLKTVIRLFFKHKFVFSLCIIGLSAGFAVFITVFMHYRFEHSYDKMHSKANNIYRMHAIYGTDDGYISTYATTDNGYGPSLKEELPEVLDYVRMLVYQSERVVGHARENGSVLKYREPHIFMVDSTFFSFFDYPLKVGAKHEVLNKPNTMVISESAAKKYFGNENPLGKVLTISTTGNPFECEITGVFYDIPKNSNLQFNFLVSMETLKQGWPDLDNSWNYAISYTYLHMVENIDIEKMEDRIMEVFFQRSGVVPNGDLSFDMELVHFPEIHLNEPLQWEHEKKGNRAETKYLLTITFIIILISWLNYINISTSLATKRNTTTRIKSILGAGKFQITFHFVAEAFLVNLVSLCLSLLIVLFASRLINTYFGHGGLGFIFNDGPIVWVLIGIVVIGTLLSGIASTIFFFVNNPNYLLNPNSKSSGSRFKQVMVVAQFITVVVLLIGTIMVYKQVKFLRSQEVGIDLDQTLVLKAPIGSDASPKGLYRFRELLADNASIIHVSAGSDIPGQFMDMGYMVDRVDVDPPIHEITDGGYIDFDYVETLGLEMVAGIDFDGTSNPLNKVLINEEMARLLNFESPDDAVGKHIQLPELYQKEKVTVIGVLKNYRQQSPTHNFKPVFFYCTKTDWGRYNYFVVRYHGKTEEVVTYLNDKWIEAYPTSSFDHYFLNDHYGQQYNGNVRFGKLFTTLCILAVLIAVLGLLGLSIHASQQRIKEIGVRKVNGAKVSEVLVLLNKDFAKWMVSAVLVGSVLAYFLVQSWLENFALQTDISWWVFMLAGILTLVIGLVTVSWQSWKAARVNPVMALRHE